VVSGKKKIIHTTHFNSTAYDEYEMKSRILSTVIERSHKKNLRELKNS